MKRLIMIALLASSRAPCEDRGVTLQVTVYPHGDLPRSILKSTLNEVGEIFHFARIAVRFTIGAVDAEEGLLWIYPAIPRQGHEHAAACQARRDIALDLVDGLPGVKATILGLAHPLASAGLNVTVFEHHVRTAAEWYNRHHETVLAYTIAHEIGHVLLRSNSHTPQGIMSTLWTRSEYALMANHLLAFTRAQSESMRSTLEGRGCDTTVADLVR